jgi:hypothetical protein
MHMRQNPRDLTNAAIYLTVLGMLVGATALGAGVVANVLASTPALQTISAVLEPNKEEEQSRMSQMIENSREIRAALAKPPPQRPPLQPITAKLAHGKLRTAARPAPEAAPRRAPKRPREAMDAMAQGAPHMWQRQSTPSAVRANPQFEWHKVY